MSTENHQETQKPIQIKSTAAAQIRALRSKNLAHTLDSKNTESDKLTLSLTVRNRQYSIPEGVLANLFELRKTDPEILRKFNKILAKKKDMVVALDSILTTVLESLADRFIAQMTAAPVLKIDLSTTSISALQQYLAELRRTVSRVILTTLHDQLRMTSPIPVTTRSVAIPGFEQAGDLVLSQSDFITAIDKVSATS